MTKLHTNQRIERRPIAWSVGLSVGVSPSEPCKNGSSDRDAVCVDDSGGPMHVAYSTTQCAVLA